MGVTYEEATDHIRKLGFKGKVASNILLVQEALSRGVYVSRSEDGRLFVLERGTSRHWWRGGNNSLNTRLAKRVTQYKSATNALLSAQDVNTTRPFMFAGHETDIAWHWAKRHGSVVIKPDDSEGGSDVFLDVRTKEEFETRFSYISEKYQGQVLVEPFYIGDQIRFLLVNGNVVAATLMRPASVEGDGRSSIAKLVKIKNKSRANHPSHEPLKLEEREAAFLNKAGLTFSSVPKKGERVYLSQLSNLQQGGDSVDVTDQVTDLQKDQAKAVIRSIPGLRVAGVDMLMNVEGQPKGSVVLEVNCSPQLSIHHFPWEGEPRNAAAHVMEAFFPELKQ